MLIPNEKACPRYHQCGSGDNQHFSVSAARKLGMPVLRKPNMTVEQNWIWHENVKLSGPMLQFIYVQCQNTKATRKLTSMRGKICQNKCVRSQINGISHWINRSSFIFISTKFEREGGVSRNLCCPPESFVSNRFSVSKELCRLPSPGTGVSTATEGEH